MIMIRGKRIMAMAWVLIGWQGKSNLGQGRINLTRGGSCGTDPVCLGNWRANGSMGQRVYIIDFGFLALSVDTIHEQTSHTHTRVLGVWPCWFLVGEVSQVEVDFGPSLGGSALIGLPCSLLCDAPRSSSTPALSGLSLPALPLRAATSAPWPLPPLAGGSAHANSGRHSQSL